MKIYNAYAARSAKTQLEPFSFDPGPLGSEEVEIEVSHCGICHSDLSMLDNDLGYVQISLRARARGNRRHICAWRTSERT
jgi:D-arabinose 1-dehydrogenase-like Zn-dependent alcohol dehydrogenase